MSNEVPNLSQTEHSIPGLHRENNLREEGVLAALRVFPELDVNELTSGKINAFEPGSTYRLSARPPASTLRQLLDYQGTETTRAEVGVVCVDGAWFTTFGNPGELEGEGSSLGLGWPQEFRPLERSGMLQFDGHTHPHRDTNMHKPSVRDLKFLDTAIDGYQYIITPAGLLEYNQQPHREPDELPYTDDQINLKLKERFDIARAKFGDEGLSRLDRLAIRSKVWSELFNQRIIPWENEEEIDQILQSKEALSNEPMSPVDGALGELSLQG